MRHVEGQPSVDTLSCCPFSFLEVMLTLCLPWEPLGGGQHPRPRQEDTVTLLGGN